ncbi:MAG: hypothetical protein MZV70_42825 [Desulfobacterales bacterium]|nr:hypothetical protein [Desulfobacterales bacterium]
MPSSGPTALTIQKLRPRETQARQGRSRASTRSTSRPTARRCSTASGQKLVHRRDGAARETGRRPPQDRTSMEVRVDPRRRVEPDVPRGLAARARLLLRPEPPRPRSARPPRRSTSRYLTSVAHRADLNYLFAEMLGELSVGHLYIGGGDTPEVRRVPGGLLGADFAVENGRYRFARVFNGENWNPQPARAAHAAGRRRRRPASTCSRSTAATLPASDNVYALLREHRRASPWCSRWARTRTAPAPARSRWCRWPASRTCATWPGSRATAARWTQMTGGALAYVHLPDTAGGGFTNFNRYYYAQLDKTGRRHRRALQRRRLRGRLHRRRAEEAGAATTGPRATAWTATHAGRRAAGPEGDDHQRVRRVGRRPDAVDVPAAEGRAAHRQADVGRAGRHRRLPGPGGRRRRHGAALRLLQPREPVGGGEPRRGAGHRGGSRSGRVASGPRHPAREGRGTGDGGTDEEPAEDGRPAGVLRTTTGSSASEGAGFSQPLHRATPALPAAPARR